MQLRLPLWAALALLSSSPVRAANTAVPAPSLDILTLNTWGLPAPIARSRSQRFPRIRRLLADLSPDVAGLQEVWRGARRLLPLPGLRYPRGDRDSGLAMLSALPTRDQRSVRFEAASGLDRLKAKGALLARVEHPQLGPIHVIVTHLQAGRSGPAQAARSAQIDELLAFVNPLEGPVMLLGDFNLYDALPLDQAAQRRLAQAGLIDAAASLGVVEPTHSGEAERLDRIYLRQLVALDAEVLPAAGLSDHHPLRVEVGALP